ncbi:MAG: tyrosine-type recombinase/integrase [Planctomycetota bacterium]
MKPGKVYVKKVASKRFLQLAWIDPETGVEKRKSSGTARRREATRAALELEPIIARGVATKAITWDAFCERYKDERQATLKRKSRSDWTTARISLTTFLEPRLLEDVTPEAISRWELHLRREGKPVDTIAKYLGTLARAMKWAAAMLLIEKAPYIAKPKKTRSSRAMKGRPITRSEFQDMLDATEDVVGPQLAESWRHTLRVLWYSGIRLSELPLLCWGKGELAILDIDEPRPLIRISMDAEKGGRDRLIGLTPDFTAFLRKTPASDRTGTVCKPLVPGRRRGSPPTVTVSEVTIGRRIGAIGEAAGVVVEERAGKKKYASAQDLRRSFGTRWASRVYPAVLKELMRHSSIRTTEQFYVELHAQQTADAVWKSFGTELGDPMGDPSAPDILQMPSADVANPIAKERYVKS